MLRTETAWFLKGRGQRASNELKKSYEIHETLITFVLHGEKRYRFPTAPGEKDPEVRKQQ